MSDLILSFNDLLFELFSLFDDFWSFDFVELIFLLVSLQFGHLLFDTFVAGHSNLMLRTNFNKLLSWDLFVILFWLIVGFLRT